MALSKLQKLALSCIGRRYNEYQIHHPVTLTAVIAYQAENYGRELRLQNVRKSLSILVEHGYLTEQTLNEIPPVQTFQLTEKGLFKAQEIILEEDSISPQGPDIFWT